MLVAPRLCRQTRQTPTSMYSYSSREYSITTTLLHTGSTVGSAASLLLRGAPFEKTNHGRPPRGRRPSRPFDSGALRLTDNACTIQQAPVPVIWLQEMQNANTGTTTMLHESPRFVLICRHARDWRQEPRITNQLGFRTGNEYMLPVQSPSVQWSRGLDWTGLVDWYHFLRTSMLL
jgi:hypothetical protein